MKGSLNSTVLYNFQSFTHVISCNPIICVCVLVTQLCLILCNPMNCSPSSSSVYEILQAKILEWVAVPSSRGIFPIQELNPYLLQLPHCRQILYPLSHQGNSIL